MTPFWRDTPLSPAEKDLLQALELAHRKSALRTNASTLAVKNSAGGSGTLESALASALLCLGAKHAPIRKIYRLLALDPEDLLEELERLVGRGYGPVPGWGSSFFKNQPDPDWVPVHSELVQFSEMRVRIESVTAWLHGNGKSIYPNAGCYTAATALILGLPEESASFLLINARLPVWTALFQKAL